jgi:hypothetical protein
MISRASGNAGAVRVETYRVYCFIVVLECANPSFACDIPKFNKTVVSTRGDEASVGGELGRLNPISVGIYAEHKFSVVQLGDFQCFVLGT